MNVLVLNSGSSSLKYQLQEVAADSATILGRGLIEKIGAPDSRCRPPIRRGDRLR